MLLNKFDNVYLIQNSFLKIIPKFKRNGKERKKYSSTTQIYHFTINNFVFDFNKSEKNIR